MTLLADYRSRPSQITPAAFSRYIQGSSILYLYDPDPRAKKAYPRRHFSTEEAALRVQKHYSPFWSLNRFWNGERKEQCFESTLAVGVDVDCATTEEYKTITREELDAHKNAILLNLQTIGIDPHMANETPKGLHLVFFIERRIGPDALRLFKEIMLLLVAYFDADDNAALATQILRFPNALHQKDPQKPFLCICLIENLALPPHNPETLLQLLRERCPFADSVPRWTSRATCVGPAVQRKGTGGKETLLLSPTRLLVPAKKWQVAVNGAGEGQRHTAALSTIGMFLRTFPRPEWLSRAWPALQEWNARNAPPLDPRELRSMFERMGRKAESGLQQQTQRIRIRCFISSPSQL